MGIRHLSTTSATGPDLHEHRGSATVESREREAARKMREKGLDVAQTGPQKFVNNTLQNMHIRYVPKQRLNFEYASPDGNLALVFDTEDKRLQ